MDLSAEKSETAAPPDAADTSWGGLDLAELPRRATPPVLSSGRTTGFQVVIHQQVLDHIHWHGSTITDREVCGILVGDIYQDDFGPFLYIEAMIEGTHASEAAAQVTFTAETWSDMQQIIDKRYPDQRVVGWYHTHPNFGIFLSEMDLFIHGNFFNLPWQVAFVFDPIRKDEGMFLWKDGGAVRGPFLVDQPAPGTADRINGKSSHPNEPKEGMETSAPGHWGVLWKVALAVLVFLLAGVVYIAATPDNWPAVEDWIKDLWSR